jgi:hypothetical protein
VLLALLAIRRTRRVGSLVLEATPGLNRA